MTESRDPNVPTRCVGWDMPVEKENFHISSDVEKDATEANITRYVERMTFTHHVSRTWEAPTKAHRKDHTVYMKNIDTDVRVIKEFLKSKVAKNWEEARATRDTSQIVRPARQYPAWKGIRDCLLPGRGHSQDGYVKFVRRHLADKVPWME